MCHLVHVLALTALVRHAELLRTPTTAATPVLKVAMNVSSSSPTDNAKPSKPPKQWRREPAAWTAPTAWMKKRKTTEKVREKSKQVVEKSKEVYKKAKEDAQVDEWPVIGMLLAVTWPWLASWMLRCVGREGGLACSILGRLQKACSRLLVATFCGAVIGVERGAASSGRGSAILDAPAGLRTMTLVASGAAVYVLACSFSPSPSLR